MERFCKWLKPKEEITLFDNGLRIESGLKMLTEKKWQKRYVVCQRKCQSEAPLIGIFKSDMARQKGEHLELFYIQNYVGYEYAFTYKKTNKTLAILTQSQTLVFSFTSVDNMLLWKEWFKDVCKPSSMFFVRVHSVPKDPGIIKLTSKDARIHISNSAIVIVEGIPPKPVLYLSLADIIDIEISHNRLSFRAISYGWDQPQSFCFSSEQIIDLGYCLMKAKRGHGGKASVGSRVSSLRNGSTCISISDRQGPTTGVLSPNDWSRATSTMRSGGAQQQQQQKRHHTGASHSAEEVDQLTPMGKLKLTQKGSADRGLGRPQKKLSYENFGGSLSAGFLHAEITHGGSGFGLVGQYRHQQHPSHQHQQQMNYTNNNNNNYGNTIATGTTSSASHQNLRRQQLPPPLNYENEAGDVPDSGGPLPSGVTHHSSEGTILGGETESLASPPSKIKKRQAKSFDESPYHAITELEGVVAYGGSGRRTKAALLDTHRQGQESSNNTPTGGGDGEAIEGEILHGHCALDFMNPPVTMVSAEDGFDDGGDPPGLVKPPTDQFSFNIRREARNVLSRKLKKKVSGSYSRYDGEHSSFQGSDPRSFQTFGSGGPRNLGLVGSLRSAREPSSSRKKKSNASRSSHAASLPLKAANRVLRKFSDEELLLTSLQAIHHNQQQKQRKGETSAENKYKKLNHPDMVASSSRIDAAVMRKRERLRHADRSSSTSAATSSNHSSRKHSLRKESGMLVMSVPVDIHTHQQYQELERQHYQQMDSGGRSQPALSLEEYHQQREPLPAEQRGRGGSVSSKQQRSHEEPPTFQLHQPLSTIPSITEQSEASSSRRRAPTVTSSHGSNGQQRHHQDQQQHPQSRLPGVGGSGGAISLEELRLPLFLATSGDDDPSSQRRQAHPLMRMPPSLNLSSPVVSGGESDAGGDNCSISASICSELNQRILRGGRNRGSVRSRQFRLQHGGFPNPPEFSPPLPPTKQASQPHFEYFIIADDQHHQQLQMLPSSSSAYGDMEPHQGKSSSSRDSSASRKAPESTVADTERENPLENDLNDYVDIDELLESGLVNTFSLNFNSMDLQQFRQPQQQQHNFTQQQNPIEIDQHPPPPPADPSEYISIDDSATMALKNLSSLRSGQTVIKRSLSLYDLAIPLKDQQYRQQMFRQPEAESEQYYSVIPEDPAIVPPSQPASRTKKRTLTIPRTSSISFLLHQAQKTHQHQQKM